MNLILTNVFIHNCNCFKSFLSSAKKLPKFAKSKSKKKKNTTDNKKSRSENLAVKTVPMLEEKQSVGNAAMCDEKDPVKPDVHVENVQLAPDHKICTDIPETTTLRTESNEDNVSVKEEPFAGVKGNTVHILVLQCLF